MRVTGLTVLCLAACLLVSAGAIADTTYGVKWKYSAKGEGAKEKGAELDVCTFRSNGTFASGPIQNGTWNKTGKKFTASISQADVQRILDQLFGTGVVNVTQIRETKYGLKEDDKGPHKTGKLKFQVKMRIHCTIPSQGIFDGHMDIKVKFSGRELP
ncbi:MAG: hypothetical protein ABIF82_11975 [Planctomycetota bacterium]